MTPLNVELSQYLMVREDPCPPMPARQEGGDDAEATVFEGPEKKLEIFFARAPSVAGLRSFERLVWEEVCADASCTILHKQSNGDFDAYLLSESSLFVYPYRVIMKTCGTTTLLLALPKLMMLAERLGSGVESVQYGHYRYKFPEQQLFPHSSFSEEHSYLSRFFPNVTSAALGPADDPCWYMVSALRATGGGVGGGDAPGSVPAGGDAAVAPCV